MRNERQEIYCHACGGYVQFVIDLEFDGNHILKCPECGHEHCRVVKNGMITGDRWDSRNGASISVSTSSISWSYDSSATTFVYNPASAYVFASWGTAS